MQKKIYILGKKIKIKNKKKQLEKTGVLLL